MNFCFADITTVKDISFVCGKACVVPGDYAHLERPKIFLNLKPVNLTQTKSMIILGLSHSNKKVK